MVPSKLSKVESYQFKCSISVINGEIVLALLNCFELLVEGGMVQIKQLNFILKVKHDA